jgi:hypothetical protein
MRDALRPWRYRSWIFPRDAHFLELAGPVLDLYACQWQGQPLWADEYVLSADEKTSIQVRRRCHPSLPIGPHQAMRIEHEYERAGVLQYLAAWDVHRAVVFGRCEPKTGKAAFGRLVDDVMSQEPYRSARRVFWIVDNGSSHRGERAADELRARHPRGASSSIHRNTPAGSIRSRFTFLSSSGKCSLRTTAPACMRWRIALSSSARGTPPWASRSPGASLAKTWNDASLNPYFNQKR